MTSPPPAWLGHASCLAVSAICGQHTWEVSLVSTLEGPASCGQENGETYFLPFGTSCLHSPSSWPGHVFPSYPLPCTHTYTDLPWHTQVCCVLMTHTCDLCGLCFSLSSPHVVFPHTEICAEMLRVSGSLCPPAASDSQSCVHVADFWDTAGQERFQSMHASYYHKAHACIMV